MLITGGLCLHSMFDRPAFANVSANPAKECKVNLNDVTDVTTSA